ncbi:MAG: NADH-quinone oxidoreductase subunit NuoF [Actinomycetota bacterium]|nr:NADH-quinone oxidoreductase subunit NuoF [Actinomycetota bacterium]
MSENDDRVTSGVHLRLLKDIDEPGLAGIDVYERRGGYRAMRKALCELGQDEVLELIKGSGIKGRGGAGFDMGMKAGFIPKGEMDIILVCNADESEPGAFKDRVLMQKNPHMLIEGCIIAARAVGANLGYIYIRGEYELQGDILDRALAEVREKGYVGDDILDSGFDLRLHLHRGSGAYIAGEETGMLSSLEGKRAEPRIKPPFPANIGGGAFANPTLVNNVETLCNVPFIVEMGPEEFKKVGTEQSSGTKVVSVSGNVQRPGNYEVALGTPVRDIVYGLAGGPPEGREVKGFFPGGSSSAFLTGDEGLDLPYSFEGIEEAGSMLGSGSIIVVDESQPLVPLALRLAEFYRHESCGKCVPCREGTNWTVKMLERVDNGEATPMDLEIMAQVQENIIGNCLCVLGDSMAEPIGSMIAKFRDEFEQHIEQARARNEAAIGEPLGAADLALTPEVGPSGGTDVGPDRPADALH